MVGFFFFGTVPHGNVDGSGKAAGADPGVHLAELTLLVLAEARLVFLHAPQRLPVLTQHSFGVPLEKTKLDSQVSWMNKYCSCNNLELALCLSTNMPNIHL